LFSIHDHFPNIIFPRKKVKKVSQRARAAKCDTSFAAIMRAQRNRAARGIGVLTRVNDALQNDASWQVLSRDHRLCR
jgi:hypothetical protein